MSHICFTVFVEVEPKGLLVRLVKVFTSSLMLLTLKTLSLMKKSADSSTFGAMMP